MKGQNIFLICIIWLWLCSACRNESTKQQPNILFIMTDDHAFRAISAYEDELIKTPNLDRIASDGALFTKAFVSNSICAPSRAVMLTGKHSHINGQINNLVEFDGTQQTFPKLLQKSGYQTAIVGKWHLKSEPTGFDYWNVLQGQGQYYNPDFIEMGNKKRIEGYATTITTDIALDWIKNKRDAKKPFCMLLHHKAPHRTWEPDTAHFAEFANVEYELPHNFYDDFKGRMAAANQEMMISTGDMDLPHDLKIDGEEVALDSRFDRPLHTQRMNDKQKAAWDKYYQPIVKDYFQSKPTGRDLDYWKYQRYMRDYLACIRSVDENIGRVLDFLKENKLEENTVVVYTSDQGFYLGEHGWFDKRFMYEQSMRTPLMIKYPPMIKPGTIKENLVQNIDFAPTLLSLAGVEIPDDIQGLPITRLFNKDYGGSWRDALYYHYYEYPAEHSVKRHYGIRTERYKLIHFYNDINEWELYDLIEDPNEMNNLLGKDGYDDLTNYLKGKLYTLQVQYNDTNTATF